MSAEPTPVALLDEPGLAILREIAKRYGVRDLRVFGSRARGEARPNSDLDLLVNIEYGRGVARRLVRFCTEASRALGMRVDVVLHARILREARPF